MKRMSGHEKAPHAGRFLFSQQLAGNGIRLIRLPCRETLSSDKVISR
jgi:hypothetical protein